MTVGSVGELDQIERRGDPVALSRIQIEHETVPHALVRLHRQLEILEHRMLLEHRRLLELAADAGVRNLGFGQTREVDGLAEKRGARSRDASCR